MKNIPNILTVFRLLLVPLFPLAYFSNQLNNPTFVALLVYILAGFTDILDGYIARKYNFVSKLGTVLDPLADKLMLISAIASLTINRIIPIYILLFIVIKECFMITAGFILYLRKNQLIIPSNIFGKLSTALFFVAIIQILTLNNYMLNISLFLIAFLVKVIALALYIHQYHKNK